jgi:hypothetical protein
MKLKLVPARRGALWVREGLRVFMRKPLAFCVLFLIYLLLGPMLMLAVAPLATIGFMIATRQALEGRFPFASVFIEPLQASPSQRWAQVRLGIGYAVSVGLVFWFSDMVGGAPFDAVRDALSGSTTTPQDLQALLSHPKLQLAWFILATGIGLLSLPFWHAPALVHWGGQGAAKALFFSIVACWRNKGALTVFVLAWAGVIIAFAFVSTLVFALVGLPHLAFFAFTPAMLILSSAFYASLYFTFVDSFDPTADGAVLPPTQEST